MNSPVLPPLEFLLDSSMTALQEMELAALNLSANMGKAAKAELREWVEQSAVAMLARWMIENREELLRIRSLTVEERFEDFLDDHLRKKSA